MHAKKNKKPMYGKGGAIKYKHGGPVKSDSTKVAPVDLFGIDAVLKAREEGPDLDLFGIDAVLDAREASGLSRNPLDDLKPISDKAKETLEKLRVYFGISDAPDEKTSQYRKGGIMKYPGGGMMPRKYENGGKNGDPKAPEGAEKGTLFYDKDAQGFYQVMPAGNVQKVENADRLMRSAPREAFGFVTREGSGNAALDEFLDKYADVAPTMGGEEGDDQTGQGYRSSVKKALNQALRTGDVALMSALLNPNGGSGAIMGVEPSDFEGAGFRSMYRPSGAAPTSLVNVGGGETRRIQAGTATEDGYQMRRPNIRDVMRMLEQE